MFKLNLRSLFALLRPPGHSEREASGDPPNPVRAKQSFIACNHPDVDERKIRKLKNAMVG